VATGSPLSQRAMAGRFGVSRRKVSQYLTAAVPNGSTPSLAAGPPQR
jgi:transcriptional regulator with XRE-family HTH domain